MRAVVGLLALGTVAAGALLWPAGPADAVTPCSVFARHPCHPTFCSVFHRGPCIPEIEYPIGQDLRLTIESTSEPPHEPAPGEVATTSGAGNGEPPPAQPASDHRPSPEHKLNTISDLYGALRTCWQPPAADEARPGMQMSVRFSFKRSGEIIGTPRVTYTTPGAPAQAKELYHHAITDALGRCTPMPFSAGLGGAVAGRPINVRYVDNRKPQ